MQFSIQIQTRIFQGCVAIVKSSLAIHCRKPYTYNEYSAALWQWVKEKAFHRRVDSSLSCAQQSLPNRCSQMWHRHSQICATAPSTVCKYTSAKLVEVRGANSRLIGSEIYCR